MKIREITMGDVRQIVRKGCRRMARQIQRKVDPTSLSKGDDGTTGADKTAAQTPAEPAAPMPRVPAFIRNPKGRLTYTRPRKGRGKDGRI